MVRERLDNWCEKGILFLVLAILMFGPLATGAVRPAEFLVVQALTSAAALLWLLRFWLNPGHHVMWPPICWAVVAVVVYAIARYQQADIEYAARQELIRVLVYSLLFFAILNNLARQETTQLISFVMIFLALAISMYGIFQFATNSEYVWHFVKPVVFRKRGSGTYINPNHLAGFLELLAPLGLAYALTGRLGHVLRISLGYASLAMLAGISVTLSRGAWISTGVSLGLFFVLLIQRREQRLPALIVVAGLIAAGAYFYLSADRVHKRVENVLSVESPDSARGRIWLWQPTMKMWQDHPWCGVGPAHFDYRFPEYRPPEIQARPGFAHNDYLNTLADWGLVGTSLIVAAFVLLYVGVFKTWKFVSRDQSVLGTKPSNRAAFVLGASVGLVAILIHSFTDFNMHVPANAILAVTLMALLSGYLRFATDRYWINPGLIGRIIATVVGIIVVFYLGQQGYRRGREYAQLELAAKETAYTPKMMAALRAAAAIEPENFETTYALGEALRRVGWDGDSGSEKLISEAMHWFQQGIRLNPYDPYNYMKFGMCLDWSGRHDEAAPYFEMAVKSDPNNYYVLAHQGWHFVQVGDYSAAKPWFEKSLTLQHAWHNPIARTYLAIVDQKLKETPTPPAK
ncbi:MAG TPA: O-antigen ligase family protein [Candidatus Angelobacter sp.]|nr:O-antigen ligase family protein [Candidatus Angelobacter sp.]